MGRATEPQPAGDTRIRKCVDAAGAVSYQAAACPPHSSERWSAPLLAETAEQAARARQAREELARNMPAEKPARRTLARSHRASGNGRAQPSLCDVARLKAAEERERDWTRIKFDRLRELDEWVRSQCAD